MRFTIVTPVYNGMRWLAECVDSIDAQRGAGVDVEHIVCDPGSKDGTREWLRERATRAHPPTLVFERDVGQTDAIRRGFERASGDVLGWLNADDVLEPNALARADAALHDNPQCVGVTAASVVIDGDGNVTGAIATPKDGSLAGLLASPQSLAQPSTFFRASAYRSAGGIDTRVSLAMDVALWLALAKQAPFALLPHDVLSRFRIHEGARSVVGAAKTAREDLRLRREAGMSLLSPAGLSLMRYAYVQPPLARLWRRVPASLRDVLRPGHS